MADNSAAVHESFGHHEFVRRPLKAVNMPNFCRVFLRSKFPASREFSSEFTKIGVDRICHGIASFGAATMGVAAQGHPFARLNK
jgi:hypothetical protein